jgi:hypothetical protein
MPTILNESECQIDERLIDEQNPIKFIKAFLVSNKMEGTKPSIILRYKDEFFDTIRIYPDTLREQYGYQHLTINMRTCVYETIMMTLEKYENNVNFQNFLYYFYRSSI